MHVAASGDGFTTLVLSDSELMFLNNAVNEVCNGVRDLDHDDEFATRLGWSRADARHLLHEVHAALG
jgi:hypothetical protein